MKQDGWISVDDSLPDVGDRVLIYIPFTDQVVEAVRYSESKFNRFGVSIDGTSHWMPMPGRPA